jgi:selenocysteine lyase/cysteine desulfurase
MVERMPTIAENLRNEIVGVERRVPLLDGSQQTYVNLDNAASTPPFRRVKEKVDEAMELYSSVHRGTGFKSLISTHLYDQARQVVADFVGADRDYHTVIFGKNTTEAINKLANRFTFKDGDLVLASVMEHHSNDLPWRAKAGVLHAEVLPDGALDLEDFRHKLEKYQERIQLVTITGASNVSGFLPPIYDLAEMAHAYGKQILVDCAQLLPHRRIDMGPVGSPRHLDFIALSGHKVYAPFGTGALIGPRDFFNQGDPDYRGGGTVDLVTLDEVVWSEAPERDEAGSPNVIGAVALAAALAMLEEVGIEAVAAHEAELTRYALQRLGALPGVELFGSKSPERTADRVGVIPFQVNGVPHAKVAAILGYEGGIGVRNGCFCAHPYVLRLLGIKGKAYEYHRERVLAKDRSELPGFVRASFGCYNNFADVDRLIETLERIIAGDVLGTYQVEKESGSYFPTNIKAAKLDEYFNF